MKKFLLIALFLFPLHTFSQSLIYNIRGHIKNVGDCKYAYLVSSSKPSFFLKVPLIDNSFEFRGELQMEGLPIKYAVIFMDSRADITSEEYTIKAKTRVWEIGLDEKFRGIILEEVTFEADSASVLKNAKITANGIYNLQSVEFSRAVRSKSLPDCVKKFNDSYVTLEYLQDLIRVYQLPDSNSTSAFGDIKQMYISLSDRLKRTPQGIKLKQQIDLL